MEIKTKFNIGDTVYGIGETRPLKIKHIDIFVDSGKYSVEYSCGDRWYKETALATEIVKPETIYELEYGHEYFYIDAEGDIQDTFHSQDGFYEAYVELGNAFLTVEEAVKEVKRRKIHQKLKKLSNGYEFQADVSNYYFYYNCSYELVCVSHSSGTKLPNMVYFESEDAARNAINEIGRDTLICDYFGVEG